MKEVSSCGAAYSKAAETKAQSGLADHGRLCFHTIQLADDPRGPRLLTALGSLTECGSSRRLKDLADGEALWGS